MKDAARELLRRVGLEVGRYQHSYRYRRQQIIESERIDLVIDVGANSGAWGAELRRGGYQGPIVSFEPDERTYHQLEQRAADDPGWTHHQLAIGAQKGELSLNLSHSSLWNSFLPISTTTLGGAPDAVYVGTQTVQVDRLDDLVTNGDRVMIKIDVQGFEREVLAGAQNLLSRTSALEVELCPLTLYEGQDLMTGLLQRLEAAGFAMVLVDNVAVRTDGRAMAFNGMFVRQDQPL